MQTLAVIVAAGRGERAAGISKGPKQYIELAGKTVLARTLGIFLGHPGITAIQVVVHEDDIDLYEKAIAELGIHDRLRKPVCGGASRQQSVRNGLEAADGKNGFEVALIHDAARPLVSIAELDALLAALETEPGVILGLPLMDTLKRVDGDSRQIIDTLPRTGLWRALTPQGFHFKSLLAAHRAAARTPAVELTDDAAVAEAFGIPVKVIPGRAENIKITLPSDFAMAEQLIAAQAEEATLVDVRTGQGFDVHKFAPGNSVWLCGVEIPHTQKLDGHSDADVGLHALTDAILGALGDGDIGQHFPPTDPQWRGAASHIFLEDAVRRVASAGARLTNVDVTLMCEAPKIGPHREGMIARLSEILMIERERIGVKATTTEGLGFTGRQEGIAAMASATLVF